MYAKIKDMTLTEQIDRMKFKRAQLIAQRQRVDCRIKFTNMKIGILVNRMENANSETKQGERC